MSASPVARLQGLSDDEKNQLISVLKEKLILKAVIFSAGILASLLILYFFNKPDGSAGDEDNREIINVVFVVVIVICARFIVSEYLEYGKEVSSPNKKLIHTKVAGKQGDKILLGNKSFGKEDVLLDNSGFDSLEAGDDVLLELSAKSNTIFSIKRIVKQ